MGRSAGYALGLFLFGAACGCMVLRKKCLTCFRKMRETSPVEQVKTVKEVTSGRSRMDTLRPPEMIIPSEQVETV